RRRRFVGSKNPYPPEGLRPSATRPVGTVDRRDGSTNRRHHHRPGAAAHREERVLRDPLAVQGQGLAGTLRGADAQAADRHPLPDAEDRRLAYAARPPRRRRHRDQTMTALPATLGGASL